MSKNKTFFFITLAITLVIANFFSCESAPITAQNDIKNEPAPPETVKEEPVPQVIQDEPPVQVIAEPVIEAVSDAPFDPDKISQEHYVSTRTEVRKFIDRLNQIIRSVNYREWEAVLSQKYIDEVASPESLSWMSEMPVLKSNRIVLRTLQDYFTYVVVPSRAHVDVDSVDIEFLSEKRVRVRGSNIGDERLLVLYDLEEINDLWIIIH